MPTDIDSRPPARLDPPGFTVSPGSVPVLRAIADDVPRGVTLRTRLFLGSVLLLAFTIGAATAFLTRKSQSVADQTIRQDLNAVPAIFEGYRSSQASARERAVRSLAEEAGTKALMAEVREHPETFHDSAQGFAKVLGVVIKTFALSAPYVSGLVMNASVQHINDSMWTIRYEFLCYLMVPLIALIGSTKKSVFIITLAFISALIYITTYDIKFVFSNSGGFDLFQFFRLSSTFLIGACFYKYRDAVTWHKKYNLFCCMAVLTVWSINVTFFEIGLIIFASYLLFNFAFNFKNKMIAKVGSKTDISYGVYLYAWPIQIAIIQYYRSINPWLLSAVTIVLSTVCGYISWICVEKPFINMKKRLNA